MLRFVSECGQCQIDGEAYRSATIAMAIIAIIAIAINVLLTIYLLRRTSTKGWFIAINPL